jgi:hypothetical protein
MTLTDPVPDRRDSTRVDLDMSMVARPKNNQSRVISGRVIDVSSGGVRAAIAGELQIGDVLELAIGLRNTSAVIRLEADIRWRKGNQYGLEFIYATASDREKMKQVIAALASSNE